MPSQDYETPPILKIHTTRIHGACPDTIRHWNDKVNKINTKTSNHSSHSKLQHYTDVSPWLTRFDGALLKKNFFMEHGEIEACCKVWGGTPNFHVNNKKKVIQIIYSFQPCGNHRQDFLKTFKNNILPHLKESVVLYTGGNDCSLRADPIVDEILNHKNLKFWYSENFNGEVKHHKINAVPIGTCQTQVVGLDIGNNHHAVNAVNHYLKPWPQNILSPSPSWNDRRDLIFTCGFYKESKGNRDKWYQWAKTNCKAKSSLCSPICGTSNFINQEYLWGNYTQYKFVLSPPGRGLDTHRTFEILMMGAVPIIHRIGSEAYHALPVVIIDHPSNITRTLLNDWTAKHGMFLKNYTELMKRMSGDYWEDLIRKGKSIESI